MCHVPCAMCHVRFFPNSGLRHQVPARGRGHGQGRSLCDFGSSGESTQPAGRRDGAQAGF